MRMSSAVLAWLLFCSPLSAGEEPTPSPFSDTAGTVFDIIRVSDPTAFTCLEYWGRGERQIWDKRVDGEPVVNAFLFRAKFTDGTSIEMAINPEFMTEENARIEAMRYSVPLGQLPTSLRRGIEKFSVHQGNEGFHAGTGQIVFYSGTADRRMTYDHLEESIFHEAVHASWDEEHRQSENWLAAQRADNMFLTDYARNSPEREDLAETALFVYAILHHPDRFPPVDTEDTLRAVPNRINYIKSLLPPGKPIFHKVAEAEPCAGQ